MNSISATGGYSVGPATESPQSRLEISLHRMADAIGDLANRLTALRNGMTPVLQPAVPNTEPKADRGVQSVQAVPPPASPVVLEVERLTDHLLANVSQLDDLLQRLEA